MASARRRWPDQVPATYEGAAEHCSDSGPLRVPPGLLALGGVDNGRQRRVASVEAGAAHRCPDHEDCGEGEREQDKTGGGTGETKQSGTGDRDCE